MISRVGMLVLESLLYDFMNGQTGRLDPSYDALQRRTRLCRQSIAKGLAMLERAGVLTITGRLVRQRVTRVSPITGLPESYIGTTQSSSLYNVHEPGAWAAHLERPVGRRAPFPCRRQMDLLQQGAALVR